MKIQLAIALFFGISVMPAMAEMPAWAGMPNYVCPTLPPAAGISWRQRHGIDTHLCAAIRIKDKKELFYVNLGMNGWQVSEAKNTHRFKGVVAGHSVIWQFNSKPDADEPQWNTILTIPLKQVDREFTVLIQLPKNDRLSAREALNLLAKMHLVLPYNEP